MRRSLLLLLFKGITLTTVCLSLLQVTSSMGTKAEMDTSHEPTSQVRACQHTLDLMFPLNAAVPLIQTLACICRHAGIAYMCSWLSSCPHSLFMEHVSILLFVCFTQWWKKMIRLPVVFTSHAQITTKTTVSMETVSSPTSWPSRLAGTHTQTQKRRQVCPQPLLTFFLFSGIASPKLGQKPVRQGHQSSRVFSLAGKKTAVTCPTR